MSDTNKIIGTRGRIRTCDLWLRKPTLYPAELHAHNQDVSLTFFCRNCYLVKVLKCMAIRIFWRGARVVELACLENKCIETGTEGSNPSLSANFHFQPDLSH